LTPAAKKVQEKKSKSDDTSLFKVARAETKPRKQKKRPATDKALLESDPVFRRLAKVRREDDSEMVDDTTMERPKSSHRLTLKGLRTGTLMLAIVIEVTETIATLSLPSNLTGVLHISNFSDQHANSDEGVVMDFTQGLLSVGDLVTCGVIDIAENDGKANTIVVSTASSIVNNKLALQSLTSGMFVQCSVQSIEDHGYQIDVGSSKVASGFLRFADANDSIDEPSLKVGQIIKLKIKSVASGKGRVVLQLAVSSDEQLTAKKNQIHHGIEFDGLQPGMAVKCKISAYLRDGMFVFFMDSFYGTIDFLHGKSPEIEYGEKVGSVASRKMFLNARILFVDYHEKRIALSCAPHILTRGPENKTKDALICKERLGHVIKNNVVKKVDSFTGVLLETPNEEFAFAWKSRYNREETSSGKEIVQLDQRFRVGDKTPCKVLSYAAIDGVMNVSVSTSVIEASILIHEQLKEGMHVTGKIFKVGDFGVLISLSDNVRGIVPSAQLSEVFISDPTKRFKVGQSVSARVLALNFDDMTKPKVVLTLKRTLVGSDLPILSTQEDAKPGTVAHGFVTKVDPVRGIYVSFFGSLFGVVSLHDLAILGVQNPAEAYPVGKVVKVKVLNNKGKCLKLSFRTLADSSADTESLKVGEIVSGKVSSLSKAEAFVRVAVESKESSTPKKSKKRQHVTASLPMSQLTDSIDADTQKLLLKSLHSNNNLENLLVLKRESDGATVLTRKPALLLAHRRGWLPANIDAVQPGMFLIGYVQNITSIGVFVNFLGSFVGFVPKANVADDFVKDANEYVKLGQTLCCSVVNVDEERGRVILSMKESVVEYPTDLLMLSLNESASEKAIVHANSSVSAKKVGEVVEATVSAVSSFGVDLKFASGEKAFAMNEHVSSKSAIQVGDKVDCRVLDADLEKDRYDVSMRSELIEPITKGDTKSAQSKLVKSFQGGNSLSATVQLIQDNGRYAILSLSDVGAQLVKAPLRGFLHKRLTDLPAGLLMDSSCRVRLTSTVQDDAPGLAAGRIFCETVSGRARSRSRASSIDEGSLRGSKVTLKKGALVQGKVSNINGQWMNIILLNVQVPSDSSDSGKRLMGSVHMTNALGRSAIQDAAAARQSAFHDYSVGDFVEAVVLSYENMTDAKGADVLKVSLSLAAEQDGVDGSSDISIESVKPDEVYPCYVNKINEDGVLVSISNRVRGYIYSTQLSKDVEFLDAIFNDDEQEADKVLKPATVLMAKVIDVDADKRRIHMTAIF